MSHLLSKKWPPFLLLGLATLLVWGHTVTFGFVWDDTYFIRDLQSVRSVKNIPAMFCSIEAQSSGPILFPLFRPIRTAHYALLHALDGHEIPQPWIFHLANVLWHGATAMMLFAALCLLLPKLWGAGRAGRPLPAAQINGGAHGVTRPTSETISKDEDEARLWAFLAALAFAVHPIVSEVVCWAKGLDDILATFFALASLRELSKPGDTRAARWLALFYFALAAYSKESAVPFAAVPFVIYSSLHKFPWRESARRVFPFFLVALAYMAQRGYIIGRSSQTEPISGTYAQTLLDMSPVVTKYFRLLWGVPPFLNDYKFMRGGHAVLSPEVLGGLVLLTLLVAGGWLAWRKPRLKPIGFGLLWTGLFLLPVSNLLPMMQYMAERFLYLPLVGWLLAAAALAAMIPRRKLSALAALAVIFLWGMTARERSWIWKDELTLFVSSNIDYPQAPRAEHNAVATILNLPHVSRAFTFDDVTGAMSYVTPANAEEQRKLEATMRQALQLFPRNHLVVSYYGICLATGGEPDKALILFEKAVRLQPKNADYWLNLGHAALATHQFDKARAAAAKSAALAPNHPSVLSFQAALEWETGNYAAAREAVLRWRQVKLTEENERMLKDIEAKLAEQNPR